MDEGDPHRAGGYRRRPLPSSNLRGRCTARRTKLAKRVNRVASSVERRGIVATYEIHDRLLGTAARGRSSPPTSPELDETQRGIVDSLDREGYVTLPFTDLVDEESGRDRRAGRRVRRRDRAEIAEGGSGKVRPGKEFVARAHSFEGVTLAPTTRGSRCASRRMLDVANAYLRLGSKLSYVDLWYTAQQPATDERVASQNWHVDFDDKHLLKAFVYLSDVGPDHGPFEYVPGSQPGGRHHASARGRRWATAGSPTRTSPGASRARRSRRSRARRARSSSATRVACTAAASRRPGRACSRRRPTARLRR